MPGQPHRRGWSKPNFWPVSSPFAACEVERRAAQAAVRAPGAACARWSAPGPWRLRDHCPADRAYRQPRRPELQPAHLQIIEADDRAGGAECEAAALADLALDRQPQRLHLPPGNAPSSWAMVLSAVEPPGTGPEADRWQGSALPARGIRRDVRLAAHRRAGAGLAKADSRLRQPAAGSLEIAVDAEAARRPVIGYAAATENARPGAARPDDVRFVDRAPRRRRGSSPP